VRRSGQDKCPAKPGVVSSLERIECATYPGKVETGEIIVKKNQNQNTSIVNTVVQRKVFEIITAKI
jgi:hypothetical protein